MKNKIAIMCAIILLTVVGVHQPAHAVERFLVTKVSSIMALSSSRFILILTDDSPFCTNVNNPKRYTVSLNAAGKTAEGYAYIYSIALAAATENLDVTVWFEDSTANCEITRIQATFPVFR